MIALRALGATLASALLLIPLVLVPLGTPLFAQDATPRNEQRGEQRNDQRTEQREPQHREPRQPVSPEKTAGEKIAQDDLPGPEQNEPAQDDDDQPGLDAARNAIDASPPTLLRGVAQGWLSAAHG